MKSDSPAIINIYPQKRLCKNKTRGRHALGLNKGINELLACHINPQESTSYSVEAAGVTSHLLPPVLPCIANIYNPDMIASGCPKDGPASRRAICRDNLDIPQDPYRSSNRYGVISQPSSSMILARALAACG